MQCNVMRLLLAMPVCTILAGGLLALSPAGVWAGDETLRIAVAANFRAPLERISARFTTETGISVRISSASTGVLANQIIHGAPFDIFLAADRARPAQLHAQAFAALAPPFCYARGALVLAGAQNGLQDLENPRASLAIGNPDTAPYGAAAMQVLARPEFNRGLKRKLVRGTSILQAFQFWASGNVDLALLPASLAPVDAVAIPAQWHNPVDQYALALNDSETVTRYLQWLKSDTVRGLITDAGYEPCS